MAAWIAVYHFGVPLLNLLPQAPVFIRPVGVFFLHGYVGNDFFFVLSGFVLSYAYLRRFATWSAPAYRTFLRSRIARLFPAYLAALLTLSALLVVFHHRVGTPLPFSGANFVANALLVQMWLNRHSIDLPSWAVSALWGAALVFPFIALATSRLHSRRLAAALAVAAFAVLLVGLAAVPGADRYVRIVCEFLVGCFLYPVYVATADTKVWGYVSTGAVVVLAVVLGAVAAAPALATAADYVLRPLMGLLVLALAYPRGPVCRLLSTRPFLKLGAVSYSLFVTHWLAIRVLAQVLPGSRFDGSPALVRLAVFCVWVAAAAAVALVVYVVVEKPGRAWLRPRRAPASM
jgi:peptidoglycan/LPS O-acetylase OafA/YrhL